jgi:hypothetical protein
MSRAWAVLVWILQTMLAIGLAIALFTLAYAGVTTWHPEWRDPPQAWLAAGGTALGAILGTILILEAVSVTAAFAAARWRGRGQTPTQPDEAEGKP